MKVKDVMTTNVRTCFMSDSLATAAKLMWDNDCGCVPVLNEHGQVVGMTTDRDICMAAFFQGVPINGIKVSAVMSRQLFDCTSDDDLSAAEMIMRQRKVRRLPVLNQDGRLVGLLSLSDIARHADDEYARGVANRDVTMLKSPAWRLTFQNGVVKDDGLPRQLPWHHENETPSTKSAR